MSIKTVTAPSGREFKIKKAGFKTVRDLGKAGDKADLVLLTRCTVEPQYRIEDESLDDLDPVDAAFLVQQISQHSELDALEEKLAPFVKTGS